MDSQTPIFNGNKEQEKKLKELYRSFLVNAALLNFKFMLLLFLSNFVVLMLDAAFVHNKAFAFGGCAINFLLNFRSFRSSFQKEHDRIRAEAKKILEN